MDNIRKAVTASGGKLAERGQISGEAVKQLKKDLAAANRKKTAVKKTAVKKK